MPVLVDRVGTFRARPREWSMSETKNGFPSFNVKFGLTERYVDSKEEMQHFGLEAPGWVDWSEMDQEVMGFFVLFNAEKALLNYDQVKKAFGWDGASFSSLAAGDWSGVECCVRVEENEYNGNVSLRVNWVDARDADPNRSLQNLDPAKLKDLDSRYKGMLSSVKPAAPAKAPAKAPAPGSKPPVGKVAPAAAVKPTPAPAAKAAATTPTAPKAATTASPSKPPIKPAPKEAPPFKDPLGCDKESAWEAISKAAATNKVGDDQVAEIWMDAVAAVAGEAEEGDISPEQWAQIRDTAISKCG